MRAREFVAEAEKKFSDRKGSVMSFTKSFPDMPSSDPYQIYRFSLALADHTNPPAEGPTKQLATVVAYTREEEDVIAGAEKNTGHYGTVEADRGSHEPKKTNTASVVAQVKRNRYGV